MSTLSEFLLARIAEDEEVANAAREHEYLSAARDASPLRWVRDAVGYGTIFANSGRILAECAAKRAIVRDNPPMTTFGGPSESFNLRHLASVYADHPDFNPEWAA